MFLFYIFSKLKGYIKAISEYCHAFDSEIWKEP